MDVNFDGDGNLDVAADALTLKTFWSIAEVVALAGCQRSAAKSPLPLPSPSNFTLPTTTMTKSTVRDRSRTYDQSSEVHAHGRRPRTTLASCSRTCDQSIDVTVDVDEPAAEQQGVRANSSIVDVHGYVHGYVKDGICTRYNLTILD